MMFFLFFLAWDLFSSQLRDPFGRRGLSPSNSHEKTALNCKFALPDPIISGSVFGMVIMIFITALAHLRYVVYEYL
jgi:hypothetical protein